MNKLMNIHHRGFWLSQEQKCHSVEIPAFCNCTLSTSQRCCKRPLTHSGFCFFNLFLHWSTLFKKWFRTYLKMLKFADLSFNFFGTVVSNRTQAVDNVFNAGSLWPIYSLYDSTASYYPPVPYSLACKILTDSWDWLVCESNHLGNAAIRQWHPQQLLAL